MKGDHEVRDNVGCGGVIELGHGQVINITARASDAEIGRAVSRLMLAVGRGEAEARPLLKGVQK